MPRSGANDAPAFLIMDAESIPDGRLIGQVKYPEDNLSPEDAITRAQEEAREASNVGSDFIPVSFHIPISVCVGRVGPDFRIQSIHCMDEPEFRPSEIVENFWKGWGHYKSVLVTFNGRTFDLPLLELAAYRYGVQAPFHFAKGSQSRYRFGDRHLDLMEFITNYGASRIAGGLNLLSKLLGKPGKGATSGSQVYDMYRAGQIKEVNDYCTFDVLDTFFVFLRSRVMTGELALDREQRIVQETKEWISAQTGERPYLQQYLDRWGDWSPWP